MRNDTTAPSPGPTHARDRPTPSSTETGPTTSTTAGGEAALGNRGTSPVNAGQAVERRRELRETMQRFPTSSAGEDCGVKPVAGEVTGEWRGHGAARITGLSSCRSPWLCPVCSAHIAAAKAELVTCLVEAHIGRGGAVVLLTPTVVHSREESLETVAALESEGWSAVTADTAWKGSGKYPGIRQRYGLVHTPVWGRELTVGENGWHPHRHVILFLERPLSETELEALQAEFYALWRRKITGLGGKAPHRVHGVDVKQVKAGDEEGAANVAAYVAKGNISGLSAEVTAGQFKEGRQGNRTPFQVLTDIDAAYREGREPEARDVALWCEYVRWVTAKRRTQMWVPPRLKKELAVVEKSEEQAIEDGETADADALAAEAAEPVGVVAIPAGEWLRKMARNLPLQAEFRGALARGRDPLEARLNAVEVLERAGVGYRLLPMVQMTPEGPGADDLPTHAEALGRDLRAAVGVPA